MSKNTFECALQDVSEPKTSLHEHVSRVIAEWPGISCLHTMGANRN